MDLDSAPVASSSRLAEFVRSLAGSGKVLVDVAEPTPPVIDRETATVLHDYEDQASVELAGDLPLFVPAAAHWATLQFYRACQFAVCRDVPADVVTQQLATPCPGARDPSTDYSVDLIFRFLPDLLQFSERVAADDALTVALRAWAREWPLSSVGARVTGPFQIDSFAGSPALLRLYADRIEQHEAVDRLADPRVATRVRADLGVYAQLAPALRRALDASPPPATT